MPNTKYSVKIDVLANASVSEKFLKGVQKFVDVAVPLIPQAHLKADVDVRLNPRITAMPITNSHKSIIRLGSTKSQLQIGKTILRDADIQVGHDLLHVENNFSIALVKSIFQMVMEASDSTYKFMGESGSRISAKTAKMLDSIYGIKCEKNDKNQFTTTFTLTKSGEKKLKELLPLGKALATAYGVKHSDAQSEENPKGGKKGKNSVWKKAYCSQDSCEINKDSSGVKLHDTTSVVVTCLTHGEALKREMPKA